MHKESSLALSANATRDSPWGCTAGGPPVAMFTLNPFPSRGSNQKQGGKSPCKDTSPSALRCPNSFMAEHVELHSRNTDVQARIANRVPIFTLSMGLYHVSAAFLVKQSKNTQ